MEKKPSALNNQEEILSTSESGNEDTTPTSPARRARLLKKSRDAWKFKTKEKQKEIKALKVKSRDLNASRDAWKERARQAEEKLKELMGKQADLETGEAHPKKPG